MKELECECMMLIMVWWLDQEAQSRLCSLGRP